MRFLHSVLVCLASVTGLYGQDKHAVSSSNALQSAWGEFSSNEYVEAEHSFRTVIVTSPSNADAYAGLGRSLYQLEQYSEAVTNLERALALQPRHTNWLLFLGESCSMAGDSSGATNFLQQYVRLRTNDVDGYSWLSHAFVQAGQFDEAVTAIRSAIVFNPTNAYCYGQLGYCLTVLGHREDAVGAFQRAITLEPSDAYSYFLCGMNLFALGRLDEATTNFETAYEIRQDNGWAHFMLFVCYLSTMQPEKASLTFPLAFAVAGSALMLAYATVLASLLHSSFRVRTKTFPGIWFSLMWLAVYAEGQLAFFFALTLLFNIGHADFFLASMILSAAPVLVVGTLAFRRQPWGKPFAWTLHLGTRKTIWLGLFGLVLVEVFSWGYSALVKSVTHHAPVQETLALIQPTFKTHPLVTFIAIAVLVPLVEEILFRGLLYGALEKRLSIAGIITVTSSVFALCHFQMAFFIPLLIFGILQGWARWKTGSIGLPMLIHVLNNGLALMVMFRF